MSSDILDRLQLALIAEREAGDLCPLDRAIVAAALEEAERLTAPAATGDSRAYRELDAITAHLGTIAGFRRRKITGAIGTGRPPNMLPPEAEYYDGLAALAATLEAAWGLP